MAPLSDECCEVNAKEKKSHNKKKNKKRTPLREMVIPDSLDQAQEVEVEERGDEVNSQEEKKRKRTTEDDDEEVVVVEEQAKFAAAEEEEEDDERKSKIPCCLLRYLKSTGFDPKWAGGDENLHKMADKWNASKVAEAASELANADFHKMYNSFKINAYKSLARV